ncbi:MAG: antitoxin component YwqK of YwqJK toxin-antitoxin module [Candidatus Omnitrophota bacterium]|jgi:antitoxin component YwqK of YwqJK toxin-antitoxin module
MKRVLLILGIVVFICSSLNAQEVKIQERFYPNGQLEQRIELLNGVLHGTIQSYDERGNILQETNYLNGNGISKTKTWEYYDNGQMKSKYSFDFGEGYTKEFHSNGDIRWEFLIKKGKLFDFKEFDSVGNVIVDQKGSYTGSIKHYDLDGEVESQQIFADGMLIETHNSFVDGNRVKRTSLNIEQFLKKDEATPYVGFWKANCTDDFGIWVSSVGGPLYRLLFCTPNGCLPEAMAKYTAFNNDKEVRLIDENAFGMEHEGNYTKFNRCEEKFEE